MKEDKKKPQTDVLPPVLCTAETHPMQRRERPIPAGVYPVIDTDLGRDNVENDLPSADLTELS